MALLSLPCDHMLAWEKKTFFTTLKGRIISIAVKDRGSGDTNMTGVSQWGIYC